MAAAASAVQPGAGEGSAAGSAERRGESGTSPFFSCQGLDSARETANPSYI